MFLIKFIIGDFWQVLNVGEGPYTAGPGQKIIDNYNVTDSPDYENLRDKTYVDFVWDDNRKHMFLFTEDLKLQYEKEKQLAELEDRISKTNLLSPAEIKVIANGIKNASTIQGAKDAAANFDLSIKEAAKQIVRN